MTTRSEGTSALDNEKSATDIKRAPAAAKSGESTTNDVGTALRNAFRATVDEDIPTEMLDLLRRLD